MLKAIKATAQMTVITACIFLLGIRVGSYLKRKDEEQKRIELMH